jgi:hypothetical protein
MMQQHRIMSMAFFSEKLRRMLMPGCLFDQAVSPNASSQLKIYLSCELDERNAALWSSEIPP